MQGAFLCGRQSTAWLPMEATTKRGCVARKRTNTLNALWRQLLTAGILMQMLHGCCVCCAAPRLGFVRTVGCLSTRSMSTSSQHMLLAKRGVHFRPVCQPERRTLQSLSCSLRTSFPHGLHDSFPRLPGYETYGGSAGVLDESVVHVWLVETESIEDRGHKFMHMLRDTLSDDELERYQRSLATPKAREQALSFLVARSLLRCTLSRYIPQVTPRCWRFEVNAHGRPAVCSQLLQELSERKDDAALQEILQGLIKLRFNLSHCAGMVVCAFAYGRDVGIDSENITAGRRIASIARRFFTATESAALLAVPESARALTFSRLWTLKEAYVKARGLGISEVRLIPLV